MHPIIVRVYRDRFSKSEPPTHTSSCYQLTATYEMLEDILFQIRSAYNEHLCAVGEEPTCILVGPKSHLILRQAHAQWVRR